MNKYIINYTKQGKILGFAKGDTDLNIEVSNAIWVEAHSYNKIIIDGDNISFDKADWRTDIEKLQFEINEANQYLKDTDWVNNYKTRHDLGLELITEDSSKWKIIQQRAEYIAFLKDNQ